MCLLAAFGQWQPLASDEDQARAYAGALLILEIAAELRTIRKALTSKAE